MVPRRCSDANEKIFSNNSSEMNNRCSKKKSFDFSSDSRICSPSDVLKPKGKQVGNGKKREVLQLFELEKSKGRELSLKGVINHRQHTRSSLVLPEVDPFRGLKFAADVVVEQRVASSSYCALLLLLLLLLLLHLLQHLQSTSSSSKKKKKKKKKKKSECR